MADESGEMSESLYELMQADIKKLEHVLTMILEDKKEDHEKSYIWMCTIGKYEAKQIALYHYNLSRKHVIGEDVYIATDMKRITSLKRQHC